MQKSWLILRRWKIVVRLIYCSPLMRSAALAELDLCFAKMSVSRSIAEMAIFSRGDRERERERKKRVKPHSYAAASARCNALRGSISKQFSNFLPRRRCSSRVLLFFDLYTSNFALLSTRAKYTNTTVSFLFELKAFAFFFVHAQSESVSNTLTYFRFSTAFST